MAGNLKTIKRRIKSIGNTQKITKAMELVAASKMQRAVNSVIGTRPYSRLAWDTIKSIAKATDEKLHHILLEENLKAEKSLMIVITSDRGLAGAFNGNIIKSVEKFVKQAEEPIDVIALGRKGIAALNRMDVEMIATFENLTNKPKYEDILPIAKMVIDEYSSKNYKKVYLAYSDFISVLNQEPNTIILLPFGAEETAGIGDVGKKNDEELAKSANEYVFEPNGQEVLNRILPSLVETTIYQALLETAASEHSARMMAMRNATDSAKDMLKELKFTFNQIRQASITNEIAEISSGKAAIESK